MQVLVLTARGESRDIVHGLEAGADEYVAKPFDNEELRARVNAGRRMIDLQNKLRQREKLEGILEMAGAVCHEINQPLQAVSGWSELLLFDLEESNPHYETLKKIKEGVDRIGELTRKVMKISKYRSKGYMGGRGMIIDIDQASEPKNQFH